MKRISKTYIIIGAGLATFFFGFGAGALLNLYLISIHSPLVSSLRGSLSFKSSIFGDGIILPIVNMIIVAFLIKKKEFLNRKTVGLALFSGLLITAYFNITQAVEGLVNWSMPTPWHWNFLGLWHAVYMLSVTSLLSLFYIILIISSKKQKSFAKEAVFVSLGIFAFLILLRLDYVAVSFASLLTK